MTGSICSARITLSVKYATSWLLLARLPFVYLHYYHAFNCIISMICLYILIFLFMSLLLRILKSISVLIEYVLPQCLVELPGSSFSRFNHYEPQ